MVEASLATQQASEPWACLMSLPLDQLLPIGRLVRQMSALQVAVGPFARGQATWVAPVGAVSSMLSGIPSCLVPRKGNLLRTHIIA